MPATRSQKNKRKNRKSKSKPGSKLTAKTADRHKLYEEAVQCPEAEVEFLDRVYRQKHGSDPASLREDFCGTGLSSCTWTRLRPENVAYGVDLDPAVLEWGREHNLSWLNENERERVHLIEGDVLATDTPPVDILVAMNFSYYTFKTRRELIEYFKVARSNVKDNGLFVCDCYGGYEAQDVLEEERECSDFTYVWDQDEFNPITNETVCHIHFHFKDGTRLKKAFSYDWRLWSIAEIREALEEAGFSSSTVYWEGTDDDGEGNGEFEPTEEGEVCAGWIAYIVADP
ncbi:MAG: class I SAM-dependent methyltransferase [Phycisphaerales bacterium]